MTCCQMKIKSKERKSQGLKEELKELKQEAKAEAQKKRKETLELGKLSLFTGNSSKTTVSQFEGVRYMEGPVQALLSVGLPPHLRPTTRPVLAFL